MTLFEQGDASIMENACEAKESVYGCGTELDFRNLVAVLMRSGSSLIEAIRDILSNKYGLYYEWRQTVVTMETRFSRWIA
jgi:hypothetical protein